MFKSFLQYLSTLHWRELILSEAFQYMGVGLVMLLSADAVAEPIYKYLKSLSIVELVLHVEIVARSLIVLGLLLFAFSLFAITYKRIIIRFSARYRSTKNKS